MEGWRHLFLVWGKTRLSCVPQFVISQQQMENSIALLEAKLLNLIPTMSISSSPSEASPQPPPNSLTLSYMVIQKFPVHINSLLQQNFQNILHFNLTNCDMRTFENFPLLRQLVTLNVSKNSLRGTFEFLVKNRTLRYLDISSNVISDPRKLDPLRVIKDLKLYLKNNPCDSMIETRAKNGVKEQLKVLGIKYLDKPFIPKQPQSPIVKKQDSPIRSPPRASQPLSQLSLIPEPRLQRLQSSSSQYRQSRLPPPRSQRRALPNPNLDIEINMVMGMGVNRNRNITMNLNHPMRILSSRGDTGFGDQNVRGVPASQLSDDPRPYRLFNSLLRSRERLQAQHSGDEQIHDLENGLREQELDLFQIFQFQLNENRLLTRQRLIPRTLNNNNQSPDDSNSRNNNNPQPEDDDDDDDDEEAEEEEDNDDAEDNQDNQENFDVEGIEEEDFVLLSENSDSDQIQF